MIPLFNENKKNISEIKILLLAIQNLTSNVSYFFALDGASADFSNVPKVDIDNIDNDISLNLLDLC